MGTQIHTWLEEIEKILLGTSATNTRFTASPFRQSPDPFSFREVPAALIHRAFRVEIPASEAAGMASSYHTKDRAMLQVWVTWLWQTDNAAEPVAYRDLWKELDRIERAIIADRAANSVLSSIVFERAGQEVRRVSETLYVGLVSIAAEFDKDLANVS